MVKKGPWLAPASFEKNGLSHVFAALQLPGPAPQTHDGEKLSVLMLLCSSAGLHNKPLLKRT